jgi:hypothetical protein
MSIRLIVSITVAIVVGENMEVEYAKSENDI